MLLMSIAWLLGRMPLNYSWSAVFSWLDWGYAFFEECHRSAVSSVPPSWGYVIGLLQVMPFSWLWWPLLGFSIELQFFLYNWESSLSVWKHLFLLKCFAHCFWHPLADLAWRNYSCGICLMMILCLSFLPHLLLSICLWGKAVLPPPPFIYSIVEVSVDLLMCIWPMSYNTVLSFLILLLRLFLKGLEVISL